MPWYATVIIGLVGVVQLFLAAFLTWLAKATIANTAAIRQVDFNAQTKLAGLEATITAMQSVCAARGEWGEQQRASMKQLAEKVAGIQAQRSTEHEDSVQQMELVSTRLARILEKLGITTGGV